MDPSSFPSTRVGDSQPLETLVPRDLMRPLQTSGHQAHTCTQTHMQGNTLVKTKTDKNLPLGASSPDTPTRIHLAITESYITVASM